MSVSVGGFSFTAPKKSDIDKALQKALFAAKEQILTDCNFYAREDTGMMKDTAEAHVVGDSIEVSWKQPYSATVYYTGKPSRDKNPNARLMWAEYAADVHGAEWTEIISKGMDDAL